MQGARVDLGTACIRIGHATDRATAPGKPFFVTSVSVCSVRSMYLVPPRMKAEISMSHDINEQIRSENMAL